METTDNNFTEPQEPAKLESPEIDATVKTKKPIIKILKQAFFFTCFSAGAAIVQIGSFTLLNELCHLTYWPAYLISLILSIIFNFTFNRKVTFKSTNNIPRAFSLVILYYIIFTPLSTLLGQNLTDIGWNEYVVLIATMLINFVSEFFYQKLFVFSKSSNDDKTSESSQEDKANETEELEIQEEKELVTEE